MSAATSSVTTSQLLDVDLAAAIGVGGQQRTLAAAVFRQLPHRLAVRHVRDDLVLAAAVLGQDQTSVCGKRQGVRVVLFHDDPATNLAAMGHDQRSSVGSKLQCAAGTGAGPEQVSGLRVRPGQLAVAAGKNRMAVVRQAAHLEFLFGEAANQLAVGNVPKGEQLLRFFRGGRLSSSDPSCIRRRRRASCRRARSRGELCPERGPPSGATRCRWTPQTDKCSLGRPPRSACRPG